MSDEHTSTFTPFTQEELAYVANASPEFQNKVAAYMADGLRDGDLTAAVRADIARDQGLQRDPVGSDIMVAGPTGMGLNNALDLQHTAQENGRSTVNEKDVELLKVRVESRVKQMIAQGATDEEIQQAASQMAGTPELSAIAQQLAQQQLDAEKFNIFNNRDHNLNEGANFALAGTVIAAAAGTVAYAAASEASASNLVANPYGLDTAPLPYLDMGPTTAALAFNPPPVPNVPDVRAPGQNRGNGIS